MGLVEDIDKQAAELRKAPDDTYEVAVESALTAAHYCPGGWHFNETTDTEEPVFLVSGRWP